MTQSRIQHTSSAGNDELRQRREALEQATQLAEQAAQLHAAREEAVLAARTLVQGRRSESGTRHPIAARDEIAMLRNELEQTKDLGMRYAQAAIRLGSEVNALKSDLKLAQDRLLAAQRYGDEADARHLETQRQMTAFQAELARMRDELAAQHGSLTQAEHAAQAQVEGWTEEIHAQREQLRTLNAHLGDAQRLYQEAQTQLTAQLSELEETRATLAQTRTDAAHTQATLGPALEAARAETKRLRAELTEASEAAQRQTETFTKQLAEAAAVARRETQRRGGLETAHAAACRRAHDLEQEAGRLAEALTHADAQRAAAQCNHDALLTQHAALQQETAALAEQLHAALRQVHEIPATTEHASNQLREELVQVHAENARLLDQQRATERDLERAHAALQEKDRTLNEALLLVNLAETTATASDLKPRQPHRPPREGILHSEAKTRRDPMIDRVPAQRLRGNK